MIYVIGYPGTSGKAIVEEMGIYKDVIFVDDVWNTENEWFNRFRGWYNERKHRFGFKILRKIIGGGIKCIRNWYYAHINLTNIEFMKGEDNFIIMICSGLVMGYSSQYLNYLKEIKDNLHLILYMYDPMDVFFGRICQDKEAIKLFDVIYNINKEEAERFKQKYYPLMLSKKRLPEVCIKFDIFFCASGEDRCGLLETIYADADNNNAVSLFIMYYQGNNNYIGVEKRKKPTNYKNYLSMLNESNCLLELLHDGYENPTQRYPEAVLYNKKLLTNNEKIKEFPCYNEKFMKIFHDVSEIDWTWVKKREPVDYGYNGEFSPAGFLKNALKEFNINLQENN